MRKIFLFGVVSVFVFGGAVTRCFRTAAAHAGAALIINDFGCDILDGDGNFQSATSDHTVITMSHTGHITAKCWAKDLPNSTGQAVHWGPDNTGMPCGIVNTAVAVSTNHWQETVSTDGNAELTCLVP